MPGQKKAPRADGACKEEEQMLFTVFAVRAGDAGAGVPARCGEESGVGSAGSKQYGREPRRLRGAQYSNRGQDHARAGVALGKRGASENEEWSYEEPGATTHTNFLG